LLVFSIEGFRPLDRIFRARLDGVAGLARVCALGLVGAGGAAGTARRSLTAPMGQSKTHEQNNQKYDWSDEVFH